MKFAFQRCVSVIGAFLVATSFSAYAAPAKSALSVKTKLVEIAVEIDDVLKTHPGLAADLLAEGRRWADQQRAQAQKDQREYPEMFRGGKRWSLERSYDARSVVSRYVSVLRTDYSNTGGAHPNTRFDTILWDRDLKKRISIRGLFKESADNGPTMAALAKHVRAAVLAEKKARDIEIDDAQGNTELDSIKPQLLKLGPVSLAPSTERDKSSGLTFHFSPYDVGAYAEGPYTAFVPWMALAPYLSGEGTRIFGGERPPGDDNQ
jgi:hypothetical protein